MANTFLETVSAILAEKGFGLAVRKIGGTPAVCYMQKEGTDRVMSVQYKPLYEQYSEGLWSIGTVVKRLIGGYNACVEQFVA